VKQIQRPEPAVKIIRRNSQSALVWVVSLVLIFLTVGVLGYFYILPSYVMESAVTADAAVIDPLYQKIDTLQEKNTRLVSDLALARRSAEIDGEAAKELQVTLSEREKDMHDLKEELNFLKSMVSPDKAKRGFGIRSFVLRSLDKPGHYAFKLVLIRVDENDPVDITEGAVKIRVQGKLKGKNKTLSWGGITVPGTRELQFSFQFFQRLEGELSFLDGFEPENILVKVEPSGKNQSSFQKIYSWSSIYQEGNQ